MDTQDSRLTDRICLRFCFSCGARLSEELAAPIEPADSDPSGLLTCRKKNVCRRPAEGEQATTLGR